jgi:hypothetical protein
VVIIVLYIPFQYQTISVIITGGFFAVLFHWGVDETSKIKKEKGTTQIF